MTPKLRAAAYSVGIAVGGVVTAYGLASGEQVAVWLGVLNAALNLLAVVNVPKSGDDA